MRGGVAPTAPHRLGETGHLKVPAARSKNRSAPGSFSSFEKLGKAGNESIAGSNSTTIGAPVHVEGASNPSSSGQVSRTACDQARHVLLGP